MLKLTKAQPRWLELPQGVRIEVEPLTTARATAARNEALKRVAEMRAEREAAERAGQPVDAMAFGAGNPSALAGYAMQFEIEALARFGIRRWEGLVGDDGQPLPVTPEWCEALARHKECGPAFWAAYCEPLHLVAAEGEGSRPSAASGGEGVAITAPDATAAPEAATESPTAPAESAPAS